MNKELQDKLYSKYPDLFAQKDLPMTVTAMCWGIDTGDGWYDLIDKMCADITAYVAAKKAELGDIFPNIEFFQVKEKFGILRVYTNYHNEEVDQIVQGAATRSRTTCSNCGSPEAKNSHIAHWIHTYCTPCRNEYIRQTGREQDLDEDDDD